MPGSARPDERPRPARRCLPDGWPRPHAYLYRPEFAGRGTLLATLRRSLVRAASGHGALVLLGGESGVGKTRLVMELAREAQSLGLQVLTGECMAPAASGAAGAPLHAFAGALRGIADRCCELGAAETARLLGRRRSVLALYEPALGAVPGAGASAPPEELPAAAARLRVYGFLSETLAALAAEQALLLVLDDLQWADDLSLGALESLLGGRLARLPLLVLGTYRTEEPGPGLARLRQRRSVLSLELDRLGEDEVLAIVGDMLALEPPPRHLARFLTRQSEGNPFFVSEYLRAALDARMLWRDERGHWHVSARDEAEAGEADYAALALPRSIRELVARRLAELPVHARQLVEAAAVVGREAPVPLLQLVARMGTQAVLAAADAAGQRQVLEVTEAGVLRFVHDTLREVAYEALDPERRRSLHRLAARAIEALYPGRRDEHLAAIARHWDAAGEPEEARACLLQAAHGSMRRCAFAEAEGLVRRYLELVPEPDAESLELRSALNREVIARRGRAHEAVADQAAVLEAARKLGDGPVEARALQVLAYLEHAVGDKDAARAHYERSAALFRAAGDPHGEAYTLVGLGNLLRQQGRLHEARACYEHGLALHRQCGDRRGEGRALGDIGLLLYEQGRLELVRPVYEQALALHRQDGRRLEEAVVLGNIGLLLYGQGRFDEARTFYEQAIESNRAIGNREAEGNSLANLGLLEMLERRPARAGWLLASSLELHQADRRRTSEGFVLGVLGELARREGRVDEAFDRVAQALAVHQEAGDRPFEGRMLRELAQLFRLCRGDYPRARHLLDDALRLLDESSSGVHRGICLCQWGHLHLAEGDLAAARARELEAAGELERLGAGPQSLLGRDVAALRRAIAALEAGAGERLFHGELLDELPEGLRRWIAAQAADERVSPG